jgi:hypothetical protein
MALIKLYAGARMLMSTTGTSSPVTLTTAVGGFLTFGAAGVQDGETVRYAIRQGDETEEGFGVYTASGTTLTRVVTWSTNGGVGGTPIDLAAGAEIFITLHPDDLLLADLSTFPLTGGTDNRILRTDGTGRVVQPSLLDLDDSGNLIFPTGTAIRTNTSAGNTLLWQARDVDGAAWTTFATLTANNTPTLDFSTAVTFGGALPYRVGGTDVAIADGGTGRSLTDPNADSGLFWDDSAGQIEFWTATAPLVFSGTTLTVSAATTSAVGVVERATKAENETGSSDTVYPTTLGVTQHVSVPKAWASVDQTGTMTIQTSFNAASVTDIGTGQSRINLTSNMSSATGTCVGSAEGSGVSGDAKINIGTRDMATSTFGWAAVVGTTNTDLNMTSGSIYGPLA